MFVLVSACRAVVGESKREWAAGNMMIAAHGDSGEMLNRGGDKGGR